MIRFDMDALNTEYIKNTIFSNMFVRARSYEHLKLGKYEELKPSTLSSFSSVLMKIRVHC